MAAARRRAWRMRVWPRRVVEPRAASSKRPWWISGQEARTAYSQARRAASRMAREASSGLCSGEGGGGRGVGGCARGRAVWGRGVSRVGLLGRSELGDGSPEDMVVDDALI